MRGTSVENLEAKRAEQKLSITLFRRIGIEKKPNSLYFYN
jgi:hypothetical protein